MSFTGDLEHLPIVDVIQLLHSTRKSGILRVKSRKGESQLVFKDGYIVSANNLDNRIRIGQVLTELGLITPAILDQALQLQQNAGPDRKPLIVTLIDHALIKEEDAYRGLEQLIEMTLVEILTWKRGSFTLDMLSSAFADEYRYYPKKMQQEMNFDTQSILMDALRIFDEKMRDGELSYEDFTDEVPAVDGQEDDSRLLSADDLGLADLDQFERKVPDVFTGLAELDPTEVQRQKIQTIAPYLATPDQEELCAFLGNIVGQKHLQTGAPTIPMIFFSTDELLSHAVTIVCEQAEISVFTTSDEQDLAPVIDRSFARNRVPILVFDAPQPADERFGDARITSLIRRQRERHPQICVIQLAAPHDTAFMLQAYDNGVRAVLPRPLPEGRNTLFVTESTRFLKIFRAYIQGYAAEQRTRLFAMLGKGTADFSGLREAQDIALVLLRFVAELCERSITLVVRGTELIAERGIGVRGERHEVLPALRFRIPVARPSLLSEVIDGGKVYYGRADDPSVGEHLFSAIGAPLHRNILLLPLQCYGKTVSITYGDFGGSELRAIDIEVFEVLARQAALVLQNSMYRKKIEKFSTS